MRNSIQYIFYHLLLIFLATSCASVGQKLDLGITPTAPIIAYNTAEVPQIINTSKWQYAPKVGETSLTGVPLLNRLKDYRPNRAFAIGYPYECGGSWHSWNYSSETSAANAALIGCLNHLRGIEKHMGQKCGARLVMVNKNLFVNMEELPTKFRVPFIMVIKPLSGKKALVYGMFQYEGPGKNLPLSVFNEKGNKVCTGDYSLSTIQAFLGSGNFRINCFDNKLVADGNFSGKRIKLKHMSGNLTVGVGKGQASDGSELNFFTGITIDYYEDYKGLLE